MEHEKLTAGHVQTSFEEYTPTENMKHDNSSDLSCLSDGKVKPELVLQVPEAVIVIPDIYYGVFAPDNRSNDTSELQYVYTDKTECVTVLKKYLGARFKGFPTYEEALEFAQSGPNPSLYPATPLKENASSIITAEKPSPFRGPKSQELVKFRKAIEKGNFQYFDECVNSNPRYLVSSGDTPSILQEGSRYNALHIACRNNQSELLIKILNIVGNREFFQHLYPDDSLEISNRRSNFLLDLYLNTPDKGLNETPLHFACKHGSLECVKHLVSYPACDKTRSNKHGEKPCDVICSRVSTFDSVLKQEIRNVLEQHYYVPIFRDEDNCLAPHVGKPWCSLSEGIDWNGISSILSISSSCSSSPISPSFRIKGYAGPMSPQEADTFYSKWKRSVVQSPLREVKGASFRILDHEKGLERVGRDLATAYDVPWHEYWEFLKAFIDLSSPKGLQMLENHLQMQCKKVILERNFEDSIHTLNLSKEQLHNLSSPLKDQSFAEIDLSHSSWSSLGELCQEFEALRLNMYLPPNQESAEKVANKSVANLTSIESTKKFENNNNNNNNNSSSRCLNNSKAIISPATEQYCFPVQSTRIACQRLSNILNDISCTIESHAVSDFSTCRLLKNKIKPDIHSLSTVLCKYKAIETQEKIDMKFVHVLLVAKTTEILMDQLPCSNLFNLSETLKSLVSNINLLQDSSSDEEDDSMYCDTYNKENNEILKGHLECVIVLLQKSLAMALNVLQKGEEKLDLSNLGDCKCKWDYSLGAEGKLDSIRSYPVDANALNVSYNSKRLNSGSGKFSRAHSFLHRILFGEKNEVEKKDEVQKVFKSVVQHLSFDEEESADVDNEEETNLEENDAESFASAVSSFDGEEMVTPEEAIKFYINGNEPTKEDLDVLVALDGVDIDENKFPNIYNWMKLVTSHSIETRGNWSSPCCRHRYVSIVSKSAFVRMQAHTKLKNLSHSTSSYLQKRSFHDNLGQSPI